MSKYMTRQHSESSSHSYDDDDDDDDGGAAKDEERMLTRSSGRKTTTTTVARRLRLKRHSAKPHGGSPRQRRGSEGQGGGCSNRKIVSVLMKIILVQTLIASAIFLHRMHRKALKEMKWLSAHHESIKNEFSSPSAPIQPSAAALVAMPEANKTTTRILAEAETTSAQEVSASASAPRSRNNSQDTTTISAAVASGSKNTAYTEAAAGGKNTAAAKFVNSAIRLGIKAKNKGTDERPLLVLHVGLPEAGIMSLQCSLCSRTDKTDPLLLQENFVYLGTCPLHECGLTQRPPHLLRNIHRSFFKSGFTWEREGYGAVGPIPHSDFTRIANRRNALPEIEPKFKSLVKRTSKERRNALIVFDGAAVFSSRHIEALAGLLRPLFRIKVLVSHRPLYDWLPLHYNHIQRPGQDPKTREWPTQDNGAISSEPFDLTDRGSFSAFVEDIKRYNQHPTVMVRDNYKRHFKNVYVIPWTSQLVVKTKIGTRLLLEYVFCGALDEMTPNFCNAIRSGAVPSRRPHSLVHMNYDLLAIRAWQDGLIQRSGAPIDRKEAWKLIRKEQEVTQHLDHSSFQAVRCIDEAKLRLLETLSLSVEKELFGEKTWTSAKQENHRKGFQKAKEAHQFCHVDTSRTLQDTKWKEFFETLGSKQAAAAA